jgi:hypothetical protein
MSIHLKSFYGKMSYLNHQESQGKGVKAGKLFCLFDGSVTERGNRTGRQPLYPVY